MHYVSTRAGAPRLTYADVILTGLARDGGLYVPETWPRVEADEIAAMAGRPFAEIAARIVAPFAEPDMDPVMLTEMAEAAYSEFRHSAVAPLVQIGPRHFVLELFHGPTLAFKDVAMQILARQMDWALQARGQRLTIVGATSGDTGSAAIEAFRGLDSVDIFILFPHGRVSEVQRRQMTGVDAANVHCLAVDGTFDDCQALVKAMFNDLPFRDRIGLAGVNSINWGRIVAQAVYYFTAAISLGAPARRPAFSVPTGNFGDVLAGYVARRMGLGIERLVVATNVNDILARTLETGRYEVASVTPTQSPSMDIQVSSNFERALFEAGNRDGEGVKRAMDGLAQSRAFTLGETALADLRATYLARRTDEDETAATMSRVHAETGGYLVDPHTAVGIAAAEKAMASGEIGDETPVITLATAHPAKFPDAVEKATGISPPLPPALADLHERKERFERMPNDLATIQSFVEANARGQEAAA